jgi:hypothetical protein
VVSPWRADPWRAARRRGLRQHAGGRAEFGLGLFGLQFQIDLIEGRERLADIDGLAYFHKALRHLAGQPKAHVCLDPRPDRADKTALRLLSLVMRDGDKDRARGPGFFGDRLIAADQRNRQQCQRCPN